jgi:sterol desaturase/sphingolipid hydroxylase (fatty acid hydroxylase superfamily)
LHHRKGYRKSGNYGKQTKLWDRLFGTEMPRIECENVDFDHRVHMPFF